MLSKHFTSASKGRTILRNLRTFSGKSNIPLGNKESFVMLGLGVVGTAVTVAAYNIDNIDFRQQFLPMTKCDSLPTINKSFKEPKTGINFPELCNGMQFVGCGVRVKYGLVKVYAVGTYMDPIAMNAIKKQGPKTIEKALIDPMYPRTIRVVMNRDLSIDKYNAAIVEALRPRMNGQDLESLERFKKMNPPIDLVEGAVLEMTVRGNTMLYKNSTGGVDQIQSEVFCRALCDVYYGNDPVSVGHKNEVVKGVANL